MYYTRYCINSKTFGGKVGGFGGEASPLHPPVDETLTCLCAYDRAGRGDAAAATLMQCAYMTVQGEEMLQLLYTLSVHMTALSTVQGGDILLHCARRKHAVTCDHACREGVYQCARENLEGNLLYIAIMYEFECT